MLRAGLDAFAHGVRDRDIDDELVTLITERPNQTGFANATFTDDQELGHPFPLALFKSRLEIGHDCGCALRNDFRWR